MVLVLVQSSDLGLSSFYRLRRLDEQQGTASSGDGRYTHTHTSHSRIVEMDNRIIVITGMGTLATKIETCTFL